ncbi:MAG TPA: kelch repeat-containing protein [Bacteroidia bacterium]|jgi:N-acetylneuraminic acid mutarotase|nr:kelch repeat-containing protein [Bacteroidia bacterium]
MKKLIHKVLACSLLLIIHSNMEAQKGWLQKANYGGTSRDEACGFSIGATGYIVTGNTGSFSNEVWAYDTGTDSWSKKGNFGGSAREGAAAVAIGGYGYVIGGKDGSGFEKDMWKYYPNTDSWSQKTSCPGGGRYLACAIADSANGKIYYGCGDSGTGVYMATFWEYDPSLDKWTSLAPFPGGQRSWPAGFCLNGKLYMGTGNDNSVSAASNDWWQYDPGTNTWSSMASVPGSLRRDASCFVLGNNGYICLGLSGSGTLNDLWMYDDVKNTWTSEANYAGAGVGTAVSFVIGNNAYAGTGAISTGSTNQFYKYTSCTSTTTNVNELSKGRTEVNIYPNPSNGIINIECNGKMLGNINIVVTDVMGRIVDINNNVDTSHGAIKLNESKLNNGIYFYCLEDSNGIIANGKFILVK